MVKRNILVGFRPFKEKKGKVLFVEKHGFDGVTGVSVDTVFINGDKADVVTEQSIGREIVLKYAKNFRTNEFYVVGLEIKEN